MGSCCSDLKPDAEFDHAALVAENENGKDLHSNPRRSTDSFFIYLMSVVVCLTLVLIAFASVHADMDRIVKGVDDCGNICGRKNDELPKNLAPCVGQDMTNYPYLNITLIPKGNGTFYEVKTCVPKCDSFNNPPGCQTGQEITGFLQEIAFNMKLFASDFVALIFTAFALTGGLLLLFRFCIKAVVWIVIIGIPILLAIITASFWVEYSALKSDLLATQEDVNSCLGVAIAFTIITVIAILIIIWIRSKIALIIQLLKETGKAIWAMPMIFIQPTLSFFFMILVFVGFVYCLLLLLSAGVLTKIDETHFEYKPTGVVIAALVFLCFIAIWIMDFIIGSQQMVVGGAVGSWYFIRDKSMLRAPIYKSNLNLFKYHLGTVAFGSMIITLIRIVKMLLRSQSRNNSEANPVAACFSCVASQCLEAIQAVVSYLSKNAYIMTAMHGYPFCSAGKRAFTLLVQNGLSAIAINSIGGFVMAMGKLLVVIFNMFIAVALLKTKEESGNIAIPLVFVFIVTFFIAHCFVVVYEMATDTIFLCFCEDSLENDGIAKPYYMSADLMNYVENSKKIYAVTDNTARA